MPYVGRDLQRGNYLKLDDITSSFDGSTTTFNLQSGGSAFYPGSAFSIFVVLSGLAQEPESAYTINKNTITFASAPSSVDDCFITALGVALGVGVPGHGTVNGSQLAKPFNYDGGLLYLDSTNDRIGIGNTVPSYTLDVNGTANFSGNVTVGGTLTYQDVASIDAVGIATFQDDVNFNGTGAGISSVFWDKSANEFKFKDNIKLSFGDSQDLKIYHDSSSGQSIIEESGPSVLKLKGSDFRVSNTANSADYIQANDGAAVKLFYNGGAAKFETTSQGTKTSGGADTILLVEGTSTASRIDLKTSNHHRFLQTLESDGRFRFYDQTNSKERFTIDSSGRVLVGTTTEGNATADDLTIATTGTTGITIRSGSSSEGNIFFSDAESGAGEYQGIIRFDHNDDSLKFNTTGSERLRITSVGICSITTPGNTADGTYYSTVTINNTGSSTWSRLRFDRSGVAKWGLSLGTDDKFRISNLFTSGSVANPDDNCFVITNSSHIGIGDNNPDTRLSVTAASGTDVVGKFVSTDANAWIQFKDNSTTDTGVMIGASGDHMMLRAGSNERLRITSTGDLSLRTTTQNAYVGLTANSTAINTTLGSTSGASPRIYLFGTGNGQSDAGDTFFATGTGGVQKFRSNTHTIFEVNADNTTSEALKIDSSSGIHIQNSLVHAGDDDTKIEFSDNQIDLRTGGYSRAYVNNYGFYIRSGFGLTFLAASGPSPNIQSGGTNNRDLLLTSGTDNPTRLQITSAGKIHVKGTRGGNLQPEDDDTLQLYTASSDNSINRGSGITFYNHDGSGYEMGGTIQVAKVNGTADNEAAYMRFSTRPAGGAAAERLRITSDGKIGIGEDDPDGNYLLIRAASTVGTKNGHIMLTGDSATNGQGPQIVFSESGSGSNHAGAYIGHVRTTTNSVGDLVFGTRETGGDANTIPTERLRITSDGNLYLGGTSSVNDLTESGGGQRGLVIGSTGMGNAGIAIINSTTGTGRIYFGDNTGSSADRHRGYINYYHNDGSNSDFMMFGTGGSEKLRIMSGGSVNIGGNYTQTTYKLQVTGSFAATTKSFVIDHPTKENHKLRYACLEGPENSVYVRGRSSDPVIELPDYWVGLVHDDSITVNVTPIGNKNIWVESINNNSVTIGSDDSTEYFYTVFAERKDVEKLEVEVEN